MSLRLLIAGVVVGALLVLLLTHGSQPGNHETNADAPAALDRNSTSPDEQGESGSLIEPPAQ